MNIHLLANDISTKYHFAIFLKNVISLIKSYTRGQVYHLEVKVMGK